MGLGGFGGSLRGRWGSWGKPGRGGGTRRHDGGQWTMEQGMQPTARWPRRRGQAAAPSPWFLGVLGLLTPGGSSRSGPAAAVNPDVEGFERRAGRPWPDPGRRRWTQMLQWRVQMCASMLERSVRRGVEACGSGRKRGQDLMRSTLVTLPTRCSCLRAPEKSTVYSFPSRAILWPRCSCTLPPVSLHSFYSLAEAGAPWELTVAWPCTVGVQTIPRSIACGRD